MDLHSYKELTQWSRTTIHEIWGPSPSFLSRGSGNGQNMSHGSRVDSSRGRKPIGSPKDEAQRPPNDVKLRLFCRFLLREKGHGGSFLWSRLRVHSLL